MPAQLAARAAQLSPQLSSLQSRSSPSQLLDACIFSFFQRFSCSAPLTAPARSPARLLPSALALALRGLFLYFFSCFLYL
eukprot:scaffold30241_cov89-Isochrysis_galbana.AAC.1